MITPELRRAQLRRASSLLFAMLLAFHALPPARFSLAATPATLAARPAHVCRPPPPLLRAMTPSVAPDAALRRMQPPPSPARGDAPPPARYLDVRTPDEFQAGHPPGAVNVPVTLDFANPVHDFVDEVATAFDLDADLLVGCKSGTRSMMAIALLQKAGFRNLANVDGGWIAWTAAELPVEA